MAAAKGTTKRTTKPATASSSDGAKAPKAIKAVSDGTAINIGLTQEQRMGVAELLNVLMCI